MVLVEEILERDSQGTFTAILETGKKVKGLTPRVKSNPQVKVVYSDNERKEFMESIKEGFEFYRLGRETKICCEGSIGTRVIVYDVYYKPTTKNRRQNKF